MNSNTQQWNTNQPQQESQTSDTSQLQQHMTPQMREDTAAISFLAMAEKFRSSDPPLYKAAAKCLFAATKTQAGSLIKAYVHFNLGKLLHNYTRNITRAKTELHNAHLMFKELGISYELNRLQCACLIAECALALQDTECILPLLQAEAQFTRKHPKIHAKALMLCVEALSNSDPNMALEISEMGQRYFKDLGQRVMECYFQLVKSLLYARMPGKEEQLGISVTELGVMLNNIQTVPNINDMRAFCYTIQLSYFLSVGMIIHSKRCLRELQVIVQNKGKDGEEDEKDQTPGFHWLRKELLTGLTYVLTSLWSIQSGQFDKAEKYYNNSMMHLGELNATMRKPNKWGIVERRHERLIAHLHFALHDGMAQMYLIKAKPEKVFEMANQMYRALRVVPKDLKMFEGQLHFVMGLYFQYMRFEEASEDQYKAILTTTDDYDLIVLSKLSLCMIYLLKGKEKEFYEQFETARFEKIKSSSMTCQTVSHFIAALHSYVHGRIQECRNHAVDAVSKCQERDILRIQATSMLLIARSFGCRDADSVIAGRSWATRTNDVNLQAWANRMILEYYEHRIKDENNPNLSEEARPFVESLQEIEDQVEGGRKNAEGLPFPKFATMTNYFTELSQWNGNII